MKNSRTAAVVGVFFGLILIIGVGIASRPRLSKPVPKPPKSPVASSELKPKSAEEILLDAEALMQRNDHQAFLAELNRIVSRFPDSYESFIVKEVANFLRTSKNLINKSNDRIRPFLNNGLIEAEDSDKIIESYNSLATLCGNYANSSDSEKSTQRNFYLDHIIFLIRITL